jgi:hypothetical protein
MEVNIILEQTRYVLLMLAAIASGAIGYLFYDAYRGRPNIREGLRSFSFLILLRLLGFFGCQSLYYFLILFIIQ